MVLSDFQYFIYFWVKMLDDRMTLNIGFSNLLHEIVDGQKISPCLWNWHNFKVQKEEGFLLFNRKLLSDTRRGEKCHSWYTQSSVAPEIIAISEQDLLNPRPDFIADPGPHHLRFLPRVVSLSLTLNFPTNFHILLEMKSPKLFI